MNLCLFGNDSAYCGEQQMDYYIELPECLPLHINKGCQREEAVWGSQCVMVVTARLCHLPSSMGVWDSFRGLGTSLESILAREPRALGLPAPQQTAGV